jgi:hypothetical protein
MWGVFHRRYICYATASGGPRHLLAPGGPPIPFFFPVSAVPPLGPHAAHVWTERRARGNGPQSRFARGAAASGGPRHLLAPGGPPLPMHHLCLLLLARLGGYIANLLAFYCYRLMGTLTGNGNTHSCKKISL